jgi:ubiquinone/menaquinone biosynthesis C-methylase UbiE
MANEFEDYVRTEWELFRADPERARVSTNVARQVMPARVLDVGSGAGQELIPFATDAFCVSTDIAIERGKVGRSLFRAEEPAARVSFVCAAGEALPFRNESFDIIICRLALPYTNNREVLREFKRLLTPRGVVLLKIHHLKYYVTKFREGIFSLNILSAIHALRVLVAGGLYHLTGNQLRTRVISNETFQTRRLLSEELRRLGLGIGQELPGSNRLTPFFLIRAAR